MLVLVVEDDEDYAQVIAHTLKRDGHDVVIAGSVAGAQRFVAGKAPDLAVIDVMLPDGSGRDLCEQLRAVNTRPGIIFLSSLDRAADITSGLDAGADDYLTKPFHPAELLARTHAVMRRLQGGPARTRPATERVEASGLEIDPAAHAAWFNGSRLNLTPIEVEIIAELARYPGQALSHAFLTEKIWGYTNVVDATLLKGHISAIRKKLRESGGNEDMVRTVHGVGYSFTPV